jgi:hypothetical protein
MLEGQKQICNIFENKRLHPTQRQRPYPAKAGHVAGANRSLPPKRKQNIIY